jgi:hypothetical protein
VFKQFELLENIKELSWTLVRLFLILLTTLGQDLNPQIKGVKVPCAPTAKSLLGSFMEFVVLIGASNNLTRDATVVFATKRPEWLLTSGAICSVLSLHFANRYISTLRPLPVNIAADELVNERAQLPSAWALHIAQIAFREMINHPQEFPRRADDWPPTRSTSCGGFAVPVALAHVYAKPPPPLRKQFGPDGPKHVRVAESELEQAKSLLRSTPAGNLVDLLKRTASLDDTQTGDEDPTRRAHAGRGSARQYGARGRSRGRGGYSECVPVEPAALSFGEKRKRELASVPPQQDLVDLLSAMYDDLHDGQPAAKRARQPASHPVGLNMDIIKQKYEETHDLRNHPWLPYHLANTMKRLDPHEYMSKPGSVEYNRAMDRDEFAAVCTHHRTLGCRAMAAAETFMRSRAGVAFDHTETLPPPNVSSKFGWTTYERHGSKFANVQCLRGPELHFFVDLLTSAES